MLHRCFRNLGLCVLLFGAVAAQADLVEPWSDMGYDAVTSPATVSPFDDPFASYGDQAPGLLPNPILAASRGPDSALDVPAVGLTATSPGAVSIDLLYATAGSRSDSAFGLPASDKGAVRAADRLAPRDLPIGLYGGPGTGGHTPRGPRELPEPAPEPVPVPLPASVFMGAFGLALAAWRQSRQGS